MMINVLSVDSESGTVRVAMLGTVLSAGWRGSGLPAAGEHHAEFDCGPVIWSEVRSVLVHAGQTDSVSPKVGVIRAGVLDLAHDGVVQLLASGDEFFVDSIGEPPLGVVGSTIEFVPDGAELYPYDL